MSHVTIAASEAAFQELFGALRDGFSWSASDSADFGPFTASYAAAAHLEGGTVDLRADNTIRIGELDIKWDTLSVSLGIDIPQVCVGGFCIIPTPFGCALRAPRICVFSADPDISLPLDLSGLLTSEISVIGSLVVSYWTDPARPPGLSDIQAEIAGQANQWKVFIDPESIDLDLLDIADIVGDLLDDAINAAVNGLLGPLPGWVKSLILAILGPIVDLIRAILDIGDDIQEWISDLLGVSFGLFDLILTVIADYFASRNPVWQFEDPFPILAASGGLIPVKVPVRDLAASVTDVEMVVTANVGA